MIKWFLMVTALLCLPINAYGLKHVVDVSLDYDYLPGEPHWAKYGSIDNRNFRLFTGAVQNKSLGEFVTVCDDCSDQGEIGASNKTHYILIFDDDVGKYLDEAVSKVFSHYGIEFSSDSKYHLKINAGEIRIFSIDGKEDGTKGCVIKLRVLLTYRDMILIDALVENTGIEIHLEDNEGFAYSDLIDRTLHGALLKIWGSRALYSKEPLGTGRIEKFNQGTYGFISDTSVFRSDSTLISYQGDDSREQIMTFHPSINPITVKDANSIGGTNGSDSAIIAKGRRISAGLLPLENVTGKEDLTAEVKSAQEIFQDCLTHSKTIKIMERDKLSDILKEQALGLSGIMNDSTAVKVGNITGLQVMIAVKISISGSYYRLSGRVINVETSAVVASAALLVPDAAAISESAQELAAKLLYAFTEEKMGINRNTMAYPSVNPRAIPAFTAAVEDAWAVECNPAALMKVKKKGCRFFYLCHGDI